MDITFSISLIIIQMLLFVRRNENIDSSGKYMRS